MPMPPLLPEIEWQNVFENAWDYATWRAEGMAQVDSELVTTYPEEQHDKVMAFLAKNRADMDEADATFALDERTKARLNGVSRRVHVVCIAEDWCPDVVRHVPVLQKMAEASDQIEVRHLMRRDHLNVLARYLTAGGEAVPKCIFLNDAFVECGSWGPMPSACREMIARGRACGDLKAARERVSEMYKSDPNLQIVIEELLHEIEIASCVAP